MKKTLKLVGIESDLKKITLLEDGGRTNKEGEPKYEKYKIWITKKDGNQTKAYTQFQAINPRAGDSFDLEVAEEEKEFNGFKYMDRTVMFFYTQEGTPVASPQAPQSPQTSETPQSGTIPQSEHTVAQRAFIQTMVADIKELKDKVKRLEDWQEKQPVYAEVNGKLEIVPNCFD